MKKKSSNYEIYYETFSKFKDQSSKTFLNRLVLSINKSKFKRKWNKVLLLSFQRFDFIHFVIFDLNKEGTLLFWKLVSEKKSSESELLIHLNDSIDCRNKEITQKGASMKFVWKYLTF